MTVHRIGNASKTDATGRLTRFIVKTLCGRSTQTPWLLTQNGRHVTCGRCRRLQLQWTKAYWEKRIRESHRRRQSDRRDRRGARPRGDRGASRRTVAAPRR